MLLLLLPEFLHNFNMSGGRLDNERVPSKSGCRMPEAGCRKLRMIIQALKRRLPKSDRPTIDIPFRRYPPTKSRAEICPVSMRTKRPFPLFAAGRRFYAAGFFGQAILLFLLFGITVALCSRRYPASCRNTRLGRTRLLALPCGKRLRFRDRPPCFWE